MGEMRSAYNILVGNPKRKDHSEDPSANGSDNIKMDLRKLM
jgi:hypothetical protein